MTNNDRTDTNTPDYLLRDLYNIKVEILTPFEEMAEAFNNFNDGLPYLTVQDFDIFFPDPSYLIGPKPRPGFRQTTGHSRTNKSTTHPQRFKGWKGKR